MSDRADSPGRNAEPTRVVYTGTSAPDEVPAGLDLRHAPLLAAEPVEIDRERLRRLADRPVGLVVYSRNAVRALEQTGADRALAPLERHTWWAVGDKTASELAERLGVSARVPADQHFEGLCDALADADLPARLVSLSLEGKFRDLGPVLDPRGIDFHDLPVYRTVAVDYAPPYDEFREADWLIFTSSRGVRHFFALDDESAPPLPADVHIAAIGPKTAATLRDRGHDPDLVPDHPSKSAIVEAIAERTSASTPDPDPRSQP